MVKNELILEVVHEIKDDLKEFKSDVKEEFKSMKSNVKANTDFRNKATGIYVGAAVTITLIFNALIWSYKFFKSLIVK